MADPAAHRSTRRAVDAAALGRIRHRLARAAEAPWLHQEAARRMADRLPIFRTPPRRVIDWYGLDGASAPVLARACPGAERVTVVPEAGAEPERAPWWSPRRWRRTPEVVPAEALGAEAGDLLWAHMGLHWQDDPRAEMARWHRALAIDGALMFCTFGPGTLRSLAGLYAAAGWPPPMAPLVDMHDLGDMLIEVGFAEPVMDQEILTLHWPDAAALLAELRSLGGNAATDRHRGLRTPRWRAQLLALLGRDGDRPRLEFEIVYGHAMRPRPRVPVSAEARIGLQDMRSILRS